MRKSDWSVKKWCKFIAVDRWLRWSIVIKAIEHFDKSLDIQAKYLNQLMYFVELILMFQ